MKGLQKQASVMEGGCFEDSMGCGDKAAGVFGPQGRMVPCTLSALGGPGQTAPAA